MEKEGKKKIRKRKIKERISRKRGKNTKMKEKKRISRKGGENCEKER